MMDAVETSAPFLSITSAVLCLTTLTTDVQIEGDGAGQLVHSQVKDADTVKVYFELLNIFQESGWHTDITSAATTSTINFLHIMIAHSLGSLTYDARGEIPEAWVVRRQVVESGLLSVLMSKVQQDLSMPGRITCLHRHRSNAADRTEEQLHELRYLTALLLANLACDGKLNMVLMGQQISGSGSCTTESCTTSSLFLMDGEGVVPVILKLMVESSKDARVQKNCVTVLYNLALSSPDCLKSMRCNGVHKVLECAYRSHNLGATAAMRTECKVLLTSLLTELEQWEGYVAPATEFPCAPNAPTASSRPRMRRQPQAVVTAANKQPFSSLGSDSLGAVAEDRGSEVGPVDYRDSDYEYIYCE